MDDSAKDIRSERAGRQRPDDINCLLVAGGRQIPFSRRANQRISKSTIQWW
jgi:hypothetical protein